MRTSIGLCSLVSQELARTSPFEYRLLSSQNSTIDCALVSKCSATPAQIAATPPGARQGLGGPLERDRVWEVQSTRDTLQGGPGWGATGPFRRGVAATPLRHPRNCGKSRETEKNSLKIKCLGRILLGHQGPTHWDIPDPRIGESQTKLYARCVFCCFRQGMAGMSRDLGRDAPGSEKLYARTFGLIFHSLLFHSIATHESVIRRASA